MEEQVLEERDPGLNKEEGIMMEYIMQEQCRDVADDGEDNSNIHDLRWYVYTKQKQDLTNREFLVSVTHQKGRTLFGLV